MAKKILYNPEDLQEAYFIVEERVEEIISKLSTNDLAVLAFALNPHSTAIGWGRTSLEGSILEKVGSNFVIQDLMYDGNGGYSLMKAAELIDNNEI